MSHLSILQWLPNEIIAQIVESAPRTDKALLCRVSQLFQELALPILNRDITVRLDRSRNLEALFSAMIQHPGRANAVRSLTLIHESSDPHLESDYYDLFISFTKSLQHLEYLSIRDRCAGAPGSPCVYSCLDFLALSHILTCCMDLRSSEHINNITLHFLARHPGLTRVRLWHYQLPKPSDWTWNHTLLPNVRHYQGSASFLPALTTQSLQEVLLNWWAVSSIDGVIQALKPLVHPDLPFVLSNYYLNAGGNEVRRILSSLSDHIPSITSLRMEIFLEQETMRFIASCLPRFFRLAYIAVIQPETTISLPVTLDERGILSSWGDSSATLRACCIGKRAWRKIDSGQWEEFPKTNFDVEAGFSVFK
ncbi:hypothetical protein FB45DRAFT_32948 [Roridomyces roridus]|uniref:F-box domain-containing protein n=1 Tax=Roridomyces roridus TaxID=1738132 RepID=A0AAD7G1Y9_9AGAR|nr:hypothetical protein FB45DRAFT_32948 [Roridomyces roridus]